MSADIAPAAGAAWFRAKGAADASGRRGGRIANGRPRERGSTLLAALLLLAVSAALSASLVERAASTAAELRARRDVLCARYAALGGLAAGTVAADPAEAGSLVGPRVTSLVVETRLAASDWCVRRAYASCAAATRTLERTMADLSPCAPP